MKCYTKCMRNHIAPCGMNCTLCIGFQREKRSCPGCRAPDEEISLKHCITCLIKRCERRTGTYCFSCDLYPCRRLSQLDKRYRTRYGMSMVENLEMIRDQGVDAFMASESERWVCRYCGSILSVHRDTCMNCGSENPWFPQL